MLYNERKVQQRPIQESIHLRFINPAKYNRAWLTKIQRALLCHWERSFPNYISKAKMELLSSEQQQQQQKIFVDRLIYSIDVL